MVTTLSQARPVTEPAVHPNGRTALAESREKAVEITGLTKRFGSYTAVDALSFSVPRGSIFGFLGPNGAGKTTTLGMLLGLVPIDGGTATLLGFDVRTNLMQALARTGALVERPAFYPYLTGRQNLTLLARLAGINDQVVVDRSLHDVDLTERANAKFGGYSTGMKQRLGIAAALIKQPDLIILDEPTSGLDPAGQLEIRNLVRDLASAGRTILLSSHLLNEVQEVCTHVAIIDRGKLIQTGLLDEILAQEEVVEIRVVEGVEQARDLLQELPDIKRVEILDGRLILDAPAEQAAIVNRALIEAGFDISSLSARQSKLEERFLDLTRQVEKEA